ncbi:MAG: hypothetical protein AAGD96_32555, partial [Chloroflexota bacterium]
ASDLVERQCELLTSFGLAVDCADSDSAFSNAFLNSTPTSAWTSFHSNHYSMGIFGEALSAGELYLLENIGSPFMGTIGCHAGLNVADVGLVTDLDLAQGVAYHGGVTIGSTAYTYGSSWDVNYTEALMEDLTQRFLAADQQPIGQLLKESKQAYYDSRGWFDPLDAKTLAPMMLYGLPMTRYNIPDSRIVAQADVAPSRLVTLDDTMSVEFPSSDFTKVETEDGVFYTFMGESIAQHHQPIQPAHSETLPAMQDSKLLKGVVLLGANYSDLANFDPVINESWVMGAQTQAEIVEPALEISQWDRDLPISLSSPDASDTDAVLNFVPGLFNGASNVERLFSTVEFEPVYGGTADMEAPLITSATLDRSGISTMITIEAEDQQGDVERIVILYEGDEAWESVELAYDSQQQVWTGSASAVIGRYRIQAVDSSGNLTDPGWLIGDFNGSQTDPTGSESAIYLPLITR